MSIYEFFRETRAALDTKAGYPEGTFLAGVYALTIMQTHGFATPNDTADYILALHGAHDAQTANEIIDNFVKGN